MYNIPFLVIGLTGPIGAGCTTLGKNICGMINKKGFSNLITKKEDNLHKRIIKLSDEIRRIKEDMKYSKNYEKEEKEKTENNYNIYKDAYIKNEMYNSELDNLQQELKKCLEDRIIFNTIINTNNPKFVYISMSTIIVMLTIKNMHGNEYISWKNKNTELDEILCKAKEKIEKDIDFYYKVENFSRLNSDELKRIDIMLDQIDKIKEQIMEYEIEKYFKGEIEEFHLQNFGNNLRRTRNSFDDRADSFSEPNISILAEEANRLIKYYRNRSDQNKINCFVIDAFRNPGEVNYFKNRYNAFYLISIYAKKENRESRMFNNVNRKIQIEKEEFEEKFEQIDERDWGDESDINGIFKQNVSKCYYLSDIAINNNEDRNFDKKLFDKFLRYYALIISPGCIQPTKEETNMNLAYSLSLRSSCISRKVGAVITDKDGFVLGFGWNDVAHGQIGCGLKQKTDFIENIDKYYFVNTFKGIIEADDLNDYNDMDSICFKDLQSEKLIKKKLKKCNLLENEKNEILQKVKIKRLEYCRALHAEENALLQVSSKGGMGVEGGVIYTTTFPCELCAKKILQSGICKIFYTEPYPNSISENIFLKDGNREIQIKQFEGVKSSSYFKLFRPKYDKKEAQKFNQYIKNNNQIKY